MEMCTIPVEAQVKMYQDCFGRAPRSYFDCGAAIGFMVAMASKMGLRASGIDVRRYNPNHDLAFLTEPYFASGQIKIGSILDAAPVRADLAYCNGTLTYMDEVTLPLALSKFIDVDMLIAIHNTTEDIQAAREMGAPIIHSEPRLIRSKQWWLNAFRQNGFRAGYNNQHNCFCAVPEKIIDRLIGDLNVKRIKVRGFTNGRLR